MDETQAKQTNSDQPFRILSIDGGGVRGIIAAIWLHRLEQKLGSPLHENFDLIAGSSTGATIACALASGTSAEELIELYTKQTLQVFPRERRHIVNRTKRLFTEGFSKPRYDADGLGQTMRDIFGESTYGTLKTRTMVTGYNLLNRRALIFKNWKSTHQPLPIWEICTASCSAPTFFPAHVMKIGYADLPIVDGGLVATNPSACALAEAVRIGRKDGREIGLHEIVLASFGTGQSARHISIEDGLKWGPLEWARSFVDVIFDGNCEAATYICENLLGEERHFRFQVRLHHALSDLDAAKQPNLNALASVAQNYLDNRGGNKELDDLIAALKHTPSVDAPAESSDDSSNVVTLSS